jgi:hypothetical protein
MELDELARVPIRHLRADLWWRHCYLPADPDDQNPLFVPLPAGDSRWRTEQGTLYLADLETTIWCEYLRNTSDQAQRADPTGGLGLASEDEVQALAREPLDVAPRGVWRVRVDLERVADFTSSESEGALDAAGIGADDLLSDDYGPCPAIAERHEDFGWQALLAPSAALDTGRCIAAFQPHHPRASNWSRLRRVAYPTVLHAYLTRFKANQRPTWLPDRA